MTVDMEQTDEDFYMDINKLLYGNVTLFNNNDLRSINVEIMWVIVNQLFNFF